MVNPFSKLTGLFSSNTSVLGVDIGTSSAKVIQLKGNKGKVVLETYGELSTGPYADKAVGQAVKLKPDQLATLLSDLMREANVNTKASAISIPLSSSLLVSIDVPDLPEEKLAKMIPIEARKYVPVPISEVMLDWSIIPKYSGGSTTVEDGASGDDNNQAKGSENNTPVKKDLDVLIVAIHKDTLKQYEEISKLANLETKFLEIETFSAMRSSLQNDSGATVILDLGATTSKMVIVDQGIVRVSHTINKGAQDITLSIARSLNMSFTKAEEVKREVGLVEKVGDEDIGETVSPIMEYIFNEVNQVMVDYQRKNKRTIEKTVLIGGGAMLKGLLPLAEDNIYSPVVLGKPFNRVEAPAFLVDILNDIGPGFAVSIGLALRLLQEQ